MTGAEERAQHPLGEPFGYFFRDLLLQGTRTCLQRDVLRNQKEALWAEYKKVMADESEADSGRGGVV